MEIGNMPVTIVTSKGQKDWRVKYQSYSPQRQWDSRGL